MLLRGFAAGVLVLLGGLVTSALPTSARVLHSDLLGATLLGLRASEAGRMIGLSLVLVGLALLASAWLSLCRKAASVPEESRLETLDLVRFSTVVWSAPLILAPPLFSRDGWSYAAQGMLAHVGLSPYSFGPAWLRGPMVEAVDPMWRHTPTPYGPLPLAFGDLVAGQTGNPWLLVVAHRVLALVGLVLLAWAVPRLAAWTGANPVLASVVVLASPMMLANGVGGLHNDLLMVGLMAAALVVAAEHSWVWGAALAGLAASVKAPGALICLGIVLVSLPVGATMAARLRRIGSVAGISVGVLVGLGVVTGLGIGWVHGLAVPGIVNTPLSVTTLVGGAFDWTANAVGLDLAPARFRDLVRAIGSVVALAACAWVVLTRPTGSRQSALVGVATALAAVILLSPVVHLWYFLWLTPFIATQRLSRPSTSVLVALSVVLGLIAPLDSSLHGAYLTIVMAGMLVAMLTVLLLVTRPARARLERIAHVPRRGYSSVWRA